MPHKTQDKITIKVAISSEAPAELQDTAPRFIELRDHAATAFRKMHDAGKFGVHFSEFRRDALARFEQAGVRFENFSNLRCGTGLQPCWTRLNFGWMFDVTIVEEAA